MPATRKEDAPVVLDEPEITGRHVELGAYTVALDPTRTDEFAAGLVRYLETGEAAPGLFAPAVFCDFTMPTWRIQENRWSALRYGIEGTLADLRSGVRRPTRDRLHELVEWVTPAARRLGSIELLQNTLQSIEVNGALRQREAADSVGIGALIQWTADRFLADVEH